MTTDLSENSPLACPAWVWSNCSNVHIAKDRSWFNDDYTPFESFITPVHFAGSKSKVVGIGSVTLRTKNSPHRSGPSSRGSIVLKRVLHVPSAFCNIIGQDISRDYIITTHTGHDSAGTITSISDGHAVAYFKPATQLLQVRLTGPPVGPKVGPSPFKPSGKYMISARWPEDEQSRFAARQSSQAHNPTTHKSLTPSEKSWLKSHYGNEYKFLQSYGLSIYKDDDREEGRSILQTIMSSADALSPNDDPDGDDPYNLGPHAPVFKEMFSIKQLDWIKKNHHDPLTLMRRFCLNVDDQKDREQVQAIVRHYMPNEEDGEYKQVKSIISAVMEKTEAHMAMLHAMMDKLESQCWSKKQMEDMLGTIAENSTSFHKATTEMIDSVLDETF